MGDVVRFDQDRVSIDKKRFLEMRHQCFIDEATSRTSEFRQVLDDATQELAKELAYAILEQVPVEIDRTEHGVRIRATVVLLKPKD